ncbi:sensor histidine kinase [Bailinhaonella thermotolerans]|uniref:sensor histidine kinase n=1 Tax=Bailinhaonella thermotolerans TaxID=1070861 RepID=UPI00192A1ADD|nr:sensor histidine kinase [Bailinhaonella thermotolerans]
MALFRDPDRPPLLHAVFWLVFLTTVVLRLMVPAPPEVLAAFGALMAVVAGLWTALAWSPAASPRRKAVAFAFLVAATLIGHVWSRTHAALVLLAMANIALVYGTRVAAGVLVAYFTASFLTMPLLLGQTWEIAATDTVWMSLMSAFVLGMAAAMREARRRREDAERLLERVRELTVAEERARMARDMHDSIGHQLTVIKMGLENAERFRDRRPDDAWAEVRQAKAMTAEALADARRWVRALRPLALDGHVGRAALERLARSFDGTGVRVTFEVDGDERRLDPDAELVLYRVLQEGLTNALRHARARRVTARLSFGTREVTLVVGDDGAGDDRQRGSAAYGFGLSSLAERVRAAGGTLRAGDADGGGFEVRASLPAARS